MSWSWSMHGWINLLGFFFGLYINRNADGFYFQTKTMRQTLRPMFMEYETKRMKIFGFWNITFRSFVHFWTNVLRRMFAHLRESTTKPTNGIEFFLIDVLNSIWMGIHDFSIPILFFDFFQFMIFIFQSFYSNLNISCLYQGFDTKHFPFCSIADSFQSCLMYETFICL